MSNIDNNFVIACHLTKINKLINDMRAMNNVTNAMCTNCPQLKVHLDKIETKFKKLLIERNQHLNQIFDMK